MWHWIKSLNRNGPNESSMVCSFIHFDIGHLFGLYFSHRQYRNHWTSGNESIQTNRKMQFRMNNEHKYEKKKNCNENDIRRWLLADWKIEDSLHHRSMANQIFTTPMKEKKLLIFSPGESKCRRAKLCATKSAASKTEEIVAESIGRINANKEIQNKINLVSVFPVWNATTFTDGREKKRDEKFKQSVTELMREKKQQQKHCC